MNSRSLFESMSSLNKKQNNLVDKKITSQFYYTVNHILFQ